MPNTQKKKDNHLRNTALVGAGLAGLGLGSYGLSKSVLSSSDHDNLSTFQSLARNNWAKGQDPRESLKQYLEYGHRAIKAEPFGVSAVGVMKGMRDPKFVNDAGNAAQRLGIPQAAHWIRDQAMPEGGLDHYVQFAESPLQGYRQLMVEHSRGQHGASIAAQNNLSDLVRKRWFGKPNEKDIDAFARGNTTGVDPSKLDTSGIESQKNALRRLINETQPNRSFFGFNKFNPDRYLKGYDQVGKPILNSKASDGFIKKLDSHIANLAVQNKVNLASASTDQKRQLLSGLDSYVQGADPKFWKQKQYNDYSLGTILPQAGNTYSGLIQPFTGASNFLKNTGIAAAAAGAGIGGYALYKMLRNHLAKKKAQRAVR